MSRQILQRVGLLQGWQHIAWRQQHQQPLGQHPGWAWQGARALTASVPCSSVGTGGVTMPSPSNLSEIMKLEHLQDKTADEIEEIWVQHHAGDAGAHRVANVMSAEDYNTFAARARASPLFVLPLAKGPGSFVTLLLQMQLPYVLFTTVEEYRRFGAGAPPHMTLTHYTEFADSKGLVLVRGDVINHVVTTVPEARTLMELTRAFYSDPEAYQQVYRFNHQQEAFDFQALLAELGHRPPAAAPPSGSSAGSGGGQ